VVELPPADGIQIAKEVDDLGLPTPPQVAGQGLAFVVERQRPNSKRDFAFGQLTRRGISLTHSSFLDGTRCAGGDKAALYRSTTERSTPVSVHCTPPAPSGVRDLAIAIRQAGQYHWFSREGRRGQSPFVRSTLRAIPANGGCPLFPTTNIEERSSP
jgi:hypothetical protein